MCVCVRAAIISSVVRCVRQEQSSRAGVHAALPTALLQSRAAELAFAANCTRMQNICIAGSPLT